MNGRPRRLPRQVILLAFAALLNDASSEMIYPLLPLFLTTTLGATPLIVGMIEAVADTVASLLKFYAGHLSDRSRRRKPFVSVGYAVAGASRVLLALAGSWVAVLVARVADRIGKGIRSAPRDAMIADVTRPQTRGHAFGFHRALDHSGAVAGPLIAAALLAYGFSTRSIFMLAAVPALAGVVMLIVLLREVEPNTGAAPRDDASASGLPPVTMRLMAPIALFALANSSDAFLLIQAHAAGVPAAFLPLLWAAHSAVKALFATRAGAFSDRGERRALLATGWTLYAVVYYIFPFVSSTTGFVLLFIAYAVPFALTEGAERAWIASYASPQARGRLFGVYYLTMGGGVLAGTALFGVLYERVSAVAAFHWGAGLAVCAALSLAQIKKPEEMW